MGRGRAPCCDKSKVKRGPWSPAEDMRLVSFIQKNGHENWRSLPKQAGLLRCGKSCRLRWINYLRPDVKRGNFSKEEEDAIIKLHQTLGNKWSKIASHFPGRTDNEIKNVWNTHLKKRLVAQKNDELYSSSSNTNPISNSPNPSPSTNNEPKEPSSSSTVSNMTNDSNTIDAPIENSSPNIETQVDSIIFDFVGTYGMLDEVNKPGEELEIPLETDTSFWEMLDSLGSFQYNNEVEGSQSSIIIADHEQGNDNGDAAHESRSWLRYIENELGLEETSDETMETCTKIQLNGDEQPASEIISFLEDDGGKLEDNPSIIMWPSPPHNFVF